MAEDRLAPARFPDQEHDVSAPNYGADFSLSEAKQSWDNLPERDKFPRDVNGLVDTDAYLEYMVDDPDDIAPIVRGGPEKTGLVHQHKYFRKSFYQQRDTPKDLRDVSLVQFMRSPYNQVILRLDREQAVHDRFEERLVSPPPIEAIKNSLIDFEKIDKLGAAAIGRRIALAPEALEYLAPKAERFEASRNYSPVEIATFFDEELEKTLELLRTPLVTPQRIVTSAIRRMARLINSERLHEEAQRRLEIDPVQYAVRIRYPDQLYELSNVLLNRITNIHIEPEQVIDDEALQTGVDEVQLAA